MPKNLLNASKGVPESSCYNRGVCLGIFLTVMCSFLFYLNYQTVHDRKIAALYMLASILFISYSKFMTKYKSKKKITKVLIFYLYTLDIFGMAIFYPYFSFNEVTGTARYFLPIGVLTIGMLMRLFINYLMFRSRKETAR